MGNKNQFSEDFRNAKSNKSIPKDKKKVIGHSSTEDWLNAFDDELSMMGYRDDSPYKDRSSIDIHTPTGMIDMSQTGIPLMANGQYLPPYSGMHDMGTPYVRETPVAKYGGWLDKYQLGEEVSNLYKPEVGPVESTAKYMHFVDDTQTPKNLSESPAYRLGTYAMGPSYAPITGAFNNKILPHVAYDEKTGFNYQLNPENYKPFKELDINDPTNLKRFVINPYQGQSQTRDTKIKKDLSISDPFQKTSDPYIQQQNIFKDLYSQNLYKFKGDKETAYATTVDLMQNKVEPQFQGDYYNFINDPNISKHDKSILDAYGSGLSLNKEKIQSQLDQDLGDKVAMEMLKANPKLTHEEFDTEYNKRKNSEEYKERVNKYNNLYENWANTTGIPSTNKKAYGGWLGNLPKAQPGYIIKKDKTNTNIENKVRQIEQRDKDIRLHNNQTFVGPYNRTKELQDLINQDSKSEIYTKNIQKNILYPLDIATDIMQLGQFIPHPVAQGIGWLGNTLGAAVDADQAYYNYKDKDYNGMVGNLTGVGLGSALASQGYKRAIANVTPNTFAETLANIGSPAVSKSGFYFPLTAQRFGLSKFITNPVIKKALNANRGVLGAEIGELIYDTSNKAYGGDISLPNIEGHYPFGGQYTKTHTHMAEGGITEVFMEEGTNPKKAGPPKKGKAVKKTVTPTKKGIDRETLIRQQYKESTFNPKAESLSNARGLAQIRANVEEDAKKAGILKEGENIFDPKVNARVQNWYMTDLYNSSFINKPGQSEDVKKAKALASYNWGRGNMLKHLNEQKAKGVDIYNSFDWVKTLPTETKDYVNKIILKTDPVFEENYSKAVKGYVYKAEGGQIGWLDKFEPGGTSGGPRQSRVYTNPLEYTKAKKAYQDSLNLYNGTNRDRVNMLKTFDWLKSGPVISEEQVEKIISKENPSQAFFQGPAGRMQYGKFNIQHGEGSDISGKFQNQTSLNEYKKTKLKNRPIGWQPELKYGEKYDPNKLYDYTAVYKKPVQPVTLQERQTLEQAPMLSAQITNNLPQMQVTNSHPMYMDMRGNYSPQPPTLYPYTEKQLLKMGYQKSRKDGGPIYQGGGPFIIRDQEGNARYDPQSDTIYLSKDRGDKDMIHELYHRQQALAGRLRIPEYDPYGLARKAPAIMEEEAQVDYPYFNRRKIDEEELTNQFLMDNPSFQFADPEAVYNLGVNPNMYGTPWTAEGEARAAESPEGREYLRSEEIGPDFLVPDKKLGGWLDKYQVKGEVKGFISYKDNPEYFNSHAVYNNNSTYNDLVRKSIYAGTHEFNPETGALRKLNKPISVPADVQKMSTKEYTLNSDNPDYWTDAQTKAYIQRQNEAAYKSPLMTLPGMVGLAGLPTGFQSAYGLSSALGNVGAGNYKTAALEAGLSALPIGPSLGKYLTEETALKNTYKINPWAFKPNESNWYRQVGKSAIDDALETGVIREAGEEVSPRMWEEFQDQIKRLRGEGIEDSFEKMKQSVLASRRPASPFFGKGKLFYPMGRKPTINKVTGKLSKNPAGKGSADYLIETALPNESFQPAYVKGMSLGVPEEIGSTAILKPDPALRNLENFNLYKKDWLRGYKEVDTPKQLPGSAIDLNLFGFDKKAPVISTLSVPTFLQKEALLAEQELARANADATVFSNSPFNKQKLQEFRPNQEFNVSNQQARFIGDPVLDEQYQAFRNNGNLDYPETVTKHLGNSRGNYLANDYGDMNDVVMVDKFRSGTSNVPTNSAYSDALHETTHSRSIRLKATPQEEKIASEAWKPMIKTNDFGMPAEEAFAVQNELRASLGDIKGNRVYTEKDIPEIKTKLQNLINTGHDYLKKVNVEDFNMPALIKSLNKIGLGAVASTAIGAGTASALQEKKQGGSTGWLSKYE